MIRIRHTLSRTAVMGSIVAGGLLVWMAGIAAQQSNFVGGNPTQMDAKAVRTLRLKVPAGSRSNWHTHTHGQLLMVEEGRMRTQKRGQAVKELGVGESDYTGPSMVHWHGAAKAQALVQINVGFGGETKWMEKVTDAEYGR